MSEFLEEPFISFISEEELFQITGKTRVADQVKVLHAMGMVKAWRNPRGPTRLTRGMYDAWLNPLPPPEPEWFIPPWPEWKDTPLGRWQQKQREAEAEFRAANPPPPPLTRSEKFALEAAMAKQAREAHAALVRHHTAKRRTVKLQRVPPWADMTAIKAVYVQARRLSRETGVPHHVDHEIPLQGKLVSGLHVHNNLQILTGSENSKKHNRFEVAP